MAGGEAEGERKMREKQVTGQDGERGEPEERKGTRDHRKYALGTGLHGVRSFPALILPETRHPGIKLVALGRQEHGLTPTLLQRPGQGISGGPGALLRWIVLGGVCAWVALREAERL